MKAWFNLMKKIILLIFISVFILGCQKTFQPVRNSDLYDFCLENNGTILSANPLQCNYQGLVYFQNTDNAINIQFCKSYYDGCNTCVVNDGVIGGCTKMYCQEPVNTPKCLDINPDLKELIRVDFVCNQGSFNVVFDNNNHLANITYNQKTTELAQVVSGSGAKYSNQNITLFNRGDEALVFDAENESIIIFDNCKVKPE